MSWLGLYYEKVQIIILHIYSRHLCEFTGLDFEMAIYEHYYEVLDVRMNQLIECSIKVDSAR